MFDSWVHPQWALGGFFHCCPFTGRVEGCCRGDQSCLSQRGWGVIKAQGLGVGQSTQIGACVGRKRWLNGGWWCDSQVLRDIRTDISDGAWHHEHPTCLEEGLFRSGMRKGVEGHLAAPFLQAFFFFLLLVCILHFLPFQNIVRVWELAKRS